MLVRVRGWGFNTGQHQQPVQATSPLCLPTLDNALPDHNRHQRSKLERMLKEQQGEGQGGVHACLQPGAESCHYEADKGGLLIGMLQHRDGVA